MKVGGKCLRKLRGQRIEPFCTFESLGSVNPHISYFSRSLKPRELKDFRHEVMLESQVGEPDHTPAALFKSTTALTSLVKVSPSRPPLSSVEVMDEFWGQAAKGLSMGDGRISWVTSDREHYKGKNSSRVYSHLWESEGNITSVVRGCFVHSSSHLGFGARSQPVVCVCSEGCIW